MEAIGEATTESGSRTGPDGAGTSHGHADLVAALTEVFRPLLDANWGRKRIRREVADFLGVEEGSPRTEGLDCNGIEIPHAMHSVSAWLGVGDHGPNPGVESRVLPSTDWMPTEYRCVYRQTKGTAGDLRSSLVRGLVLVEHAGERAAVHVARSSTGPFEEFEAAVDLHPSVDPGKSAIVAGLREAFDHRAATRGRHVVFDSNGMRPLVPFDVDWDDVVLPELVIEEVRRNTTLFLRARATDARALLPESRTVLLSGPPGTGKTCIARALEAELRGTTFAWVTPGAFEKVPDPAFFFEWVRNRAPALLYFEDVDLVAGHRGHGTTGSFLGEILAQLDGFASNLDVVVVATTNDADALDEALRRPGRFDRRLDVGLPEEPERRRMLARFLEGHGVTDRQTALDHLAQVTAGLSGAHLRELVDTAILDEVVDPSKLGTPFSLGDLERALAVLRHTRKDIGFTRREDRPRPPAAIPVSAGIRPRRRGEIPF